MSLTDFFRINLPFGICKNSKNEWFAFNREHMPLGWNDQFKERSIFKDDPYSDYPIHTKYVGLTEKKLLEIAGRQDRICRENNGFGEIKIVFLYSDQANPQSSPEHWDDYIKKIQMLSELEVSSNR